MNYTELLTEEEIKELEQRHNNKMRKFRIKNIVIGNRALGYILEVKTFFGWRYWQNKNNGTYKWLESDDIEERKHIKRLVNHLNGILID